jgi:hypothetical protein
MSPVSLASIVERSANWIRTGVASFLLFFRYGYLEDTICRVHPESMINTESSLDCDLQSLSFRNENMESEFNEQNTFFF